MSATINDRGELNFLFYKSHKYFKYFINNILVVVCDLVDTYILIYSLFEKKTTERKFYRTIINSIDCNFPTLLIFLSKGILFKMRKWNDKFAWFQNIVSIKHLSDGRFKACIINIIKKKLHDICLWYHNHLLFWMLKVIHVN